MKQPYATANRAIWLAFTFMRATQFSRDGIFPAHLAQNSGMTRLESALALRCLEKDDMAVRRKDGRFFLTEKGRNA